MTEHDPQIELWEKIDYFSTVLVDSDIIALCNNRQLIVEGFEEKQVYQTCYDLRVGEKAYSWYRNAYVDISEGSPLEIRPREVINILTLEAVKLPDFIAGRIFSRVSVVSAAISHISTYIDPGFEGHLRISVVNHGNRCVTLKYGGSLCKVEFVKLGRSVAEAYRGVHHDPDPKTPLAADLSDPRTISDKQLVDAEFLENEALFFGEPFDTLFRIAIDHANKLGKLEQDALVPEPRLKDIAKNVWLEEWTKLTDRQASRRAALWAAVVGALVAGGITLLGLLF